MTDSPMTLKCDVGRIKSSQKKESSVRKILLASIAFIAFCFPTDLIAKDFCGLESKTLPPVQNIQGKWGLKIIFFNLGQADAILLMTPNGDTCLIDSGKNATHGDRVADFLSSKTQNGVGTIQTVGVLLRCSRKTGQKTGLN